MGISEDLAAVHRALAYKKMNEGIENHVTCVADSKEIFKKDLIKILKILLI